LETQLHILRIFEFIACITGFIYWRKIKTSAFKWFPVYLGFIVISEYIGVSLHNTADNGMLNAAFFNYFEIPVEFLFFFALFYFTQTSGSYKKLIVLCACLYLLSWFLDMVVLKNIEGAFHSFSCTTGNLLLLVVILRYFVFLVTSNNILYFWKDMLFWICTGLLVYYLGTFPYYGLRNTLALNYPNLFTTYSYIVYILDSLMYIMFTFSFIWGKPNIKSL